MRANLVCPSVFELGETGKIAVLSVAEGDDKPKKYPAISAKTGEGMKDWYDWFIQSVKDVV